MPGQNAWHFLVKCLAKCLAFPPDGGNPKQAKYQLIDFLSELNLPISIESIYLKNATSDELHKACKFACKDNSDIHQLPFQIKEKDLLEAIQSYKSSPTSPYIGLK